MAWSSDYSAIDVTEDALPAFMARVREDVRQGESWRGLSVTMPLKSGMVREVDEVRGVARALGVVNTVAFERPAPGDAGATRLVGYNTDVAGIVNALRHAGAASAPTAVVLGGGGTAAAADRSAEGTGRTGRGSLRPRCQPRRGGTGGRCRRRPARPGPARWPGRPPPSPRPTS